MIAKMWKTMIKHTHSRLRHLIDHMCSKKLISVEQMIKIVSKSSHRQKIIELLMHIEKKGWQSLMKLIEAIKQIEPLHLLAKEIDEQLAEQTNEPMTERMTNQTNRCIKLYLH